MGCLFATIEGSALSTDAFEFTGVSVAALLIGGAFTFGGTGFATEVATSQLKTFVASFSGLIALIVDGATFAGYRLEFANATLGKVTELRIRIAFFGSTGIFTKLNARKTDKNTLAYDEFFANFFFAIISCRTIGVFFTAFETLASIFQTL